MSIKYKGKTISGGGSSLPPGGTTDQILAKASDADGDVKWSNGVTMEQVNNAINTAITGAIEGAY